MARQNSSFRDRFFTPKVAEAIMSPTGILLAGAGSAIGIATGLAIPVAIGMGVAGWGANVARAIGSGAGPTPVDAAASELRGGWRQLAAEAVAQRQRFDQAIDRAQDGPLTDRMRMLAERLDSAIDDSASLAVSGQRKEEALAFLDERGLYGRAKQTRAELADPRTPESIKPTLAQTAESYDNQLMMAQRLRVGIQDIHAQLRLRIAQLSEVVGHSIDLSTGARTVGDLDPVGAEIDEVVSGLESLRLALEELDEPGTPQLG